MNLAYTVGVVNLGVVNLGVFGQKQKICEICPQKNSNFISETRSSTASQIHNRIEYRVYLVSYGSLQKV